jgi:hypothetical protein
MFDAISSHRMWGTPFANGFRQDKTTTNIGRRETLNVSLRRSQDPGAGDVELSPADLKQIDTAASSITAEGNRYPEHLEKMTGH